MKISDSALWFSGQRGSHSSESVDWSHTRLLTTETLFKENKFSQKISENTDYKNIIRFFDRIFQKITNLKKFSYDLFFIEL